MNSITYFYGRKPAYILIQRPSNSPIRHNRAQTINRKLSGRPRALGYLQVTNRVLAPVSVAKSSERRHDYPRVVAMLNRNWRVIICRGGIQWILQERKGRLNGMPRWQGRSFSRSKVGLQRSIRELAGTVERGAISVINELPEWVEQ